MQNYLSLIRNNPDFGRLWLAQVVSSLGDWFNTIVLSALIVKFTAGSGYEGTAVSGFLLARMIPPMLFSPFAGVLVDRFDRKMLLIASDILRAGIVSLLLFAVQSASLLWLIYLLTAIQFTIASIFEPARNAILPALLDKKDLVIANTLSSATWSVMLAVGAIVGGILAALFGVEVALILDALTFMVSAVLIYYIKQRSDYLEEVQTQREHVDTSLKEGIRYFLQHPATALVILVKTMLSVGSTDPILIIYGTALFAIGEDGTVSMAILWFAMGLGAVLGPVILNRFTDGSVRSLRHMMLIGFIWLPLGWFMLGWAPTLFLAAVSILVRGMGGSANWTYSSVIIQKTVPDAYLGRMFSLDMTGFQFMQAISTIATGIIIDAIGAPEVRTVVYILGALSLIPLIIWAVAIVRLDRQEAAATPVGD